MKLNISDIQHFSLGDGDGIRTTVFFKGCNLHCPWCHNPETISSKPQVLRYAEHGSEKQFGRLLDAVEVFEEVMTDLDFYKESGGGVTLSGGEVMLQADGARELAELLQKSGVHVIVDTAGNVNYELFRKLNPYVSEYYYDYKACTNEDYSRVIGGDHDRVYDNLKRLVKEEASVRVRIPLIEGFNADCEYSERMCEKLCAANIQKVDLLPFHNLGSGKYTALNLPYAYRGKASMTIVQAEVAASIYRKYFQVKIEH